MRRATESAGPWLGAHVSIAGGLALALVRARELGADALQIFVKSARQWSARALVPSEVEAFRKGAADGGLARRVLAHGSYLLNLASPEEADWRRTIAALRVELERCASLEIPYLVVHPGAHLDRGEPAALERVAAALGHTLADAPATGRVKLLLETTAGQGTQLGYRFEQLAWILEHSGVAHRLGVCFDTCHVLAAGYALGDARSFERTFAEFERTIGLERLLAFHLNDSRYPAGSRRDRHEHIGRGALGLEPFRRILNDERFRDLPMVLETPEGDGLALHRRNLDLLRSLLHGARR
jgi:deoxyribonuclease-4